MWLEEETARLVPCLDRGFFGGAKSSARSDELRSYEGDVPLNSIGLEKTEFGEGQKERGREAKKGGRTEDESGPSLVGTNLGKLRGGPTLPPPRKILGLAKIVRKVHFLKSENPLSDFGKTFSEIRKALSEIRQTLSEIRKALSEVRKPTFWSQKSTS